MNYRVTLRYTEEIEIEVWAESKEQAEIAAMGLFEPGQNSDSAKGLGVVSVEEVSTPVDDE